MTRWLEPPHIDIPASFESLGLHPLVAGTLLRRGITDPKAIRAFLHPEAQPSTPYPDLQFGSIGGIDSAI
ncbi:MAG TPA: hypothetical protein DCZ69_05830, partial [Syntrophobacteraceae bacterium]|nr:hypothetical protein [Syntrophobacteraceae bacterium]